MTDDIYNPTVLYIYIYIYRYKTASNEKYDSVKSGRRGREGGIYETGKIGLDRRLKSITGRAAQCLYPLKTGRAGCDGCVT